MTEKLSFEEILDQVMLEEPRPTHEALVRWSERYPECRERLAQYFATWAIQSARAAMEPKTVVDEDRIAREGVEHAMSILRKQRRLISPESIGPLSERDQLVLTAIYLLGGSGYPVTIALKVGEMQEKKPLLGLVFASLESLERKGLIVPRPADPVTEPEHTGIRDYYTVTMAGSRALAQVKETSTLLARFLPDFA